MLYALTSAYSRKDYDNQQCGLPLVTNIGKLFSVFAWGLDIIQEQAEKVKLWDNLDNASGAVLDRYGANFGVKRNGTTDDFYRLEIKVKVMAQLSGGDDDTVINAAAELLGVNTTDIKLDDVWPAKIRLYVDRSLLDSERIELIEEIAYAIKRLLAAGVGMRIYLRTYRTYRHDLHISRGGMVSTAVCSVPAAVVRADTLHILRKNAAFAQTGISAEPIGVDKDYHNPVPVAFGSCLSAILDGEIPPESTKNVESRQKIASGAIYRTHITPRRID